MSKIIFILLAVTLFLFIGCQQQTEDSGLTVFELEVRNASTVKIYPKISTAVSQQRFGFLGVGSSAVYGFSPFRLGDSITITWSEGISEEIHKKIVNTAPLAKQAQGIYTLNFVYLGGRVWEVRVLDKQGRELNKITQ
jgi:uncharacterized lipoprotein NlpE involved in copper resistance